MSKDTRERLTYWLFLILGFVGIIIQMYKYFSNTLELTFAEGGLTVIFVVFIFRPKILIEAAQTVINFKFKK